MRSSYIGLVLLFAVAITAMPDSSSVARDGNETGAQTTAQATPSTAPRRKRATEPSLQIACTRVGCHPIPRGCQIEKEYSWDGTPTGFDLVVCPFR